MLMPQMSKLPFLLVSFSLVIFFLLWMIKVWFSKNPYSKVLNSSNFKIGSKKWPLNYFW